MKFKRFSILIFATSLFLTGCGESPAPEHVHQWGDPTYTWRADNSTCTAERVCELDDSHVENEVSNSKYTVITAPTETTEGLGRYTATFTNTAFTTQTTDVVIPVISDIDTYEKAVNSVTSKHNYSAHLNNQWANETEPFVDYNFYNIDDNAMYDDLSQYFYSGYIKQKGQGIVTFQLNKEATTTAGLILGNFVATNLERNISDIYTLAVEHLADKDFTYDAELGMYKSTSMDAIAVLANLGFGDYTSLVSAPEYITAKFENGALTYRGVFDINYFDEVEVHTTGDVTLVVTNFEKTHHSVVESYVAAPDYTYVAPTEWDEETTALLKQEFNNLIPPFIEGVSYAWKAGQGVSEGYYVAMVEDYFGGDLTTKYRTALEGAGFHEVTNPGLIEYQMVVEEEYVIHTYSVKMKYYSPTDKDSSKMEYGYLYPNGVSSFKFLHKQKTKQTIVTVDLLNQFIDTFAAGEYLPAFSFAGDTKVTNVHDATSSDENLALLLKGTDGAFFRIYAKTKEEAVTAVEAYINELKKLGFSGSSSQMFQQYWMSDDNFSVIKITDPKYASSWSSTTYLQVSIEITLATLEAWQQEVVTLDSLSVTGQTTLFTVGDTFKFDGKAIATYSNGFEEEVTPTEIVEPDMSKAGQQVVVVKYTNSKGEQVATDYTVTINSSDTTYPITYTPVTGVSYSQSYPVSGNEQKAGQPVNFAVNVEDGYKLNKVTAVDANGNSIDVSGPIPPSFGYSLTMPTGGVTITADVSIVVPTHNITYKVYEVVDNTTFNPLDYNDVIGSGSNLPKTAEENSIINFSVALKTGYTFNFVTVGTDVFTNSSFQYQMGQSDLEVYIYLKADQGGGGGDTTEFGGTYSFYKGKMGGKDTYFRITFNDDGTGTYVRDPYNDGTATIYFTYILNGDKIKMTLTDVGDGFNCFGTYRPFDFDTIGTTNSTGEVNPDGSISLDLYNATSGGNPATSSGNYAFRK